MGDPKVPHLPFSAIQSIRPASGQPVAQRERGANCILFLSERIVYVILCIIAHAVLTVVCTAHEHGISFFIIGLLFPIALPANPSLTLWMSTSLIFLTIPTHATRSTEATAREEGVITHTAQEMFAFRRARNARKCHQLWVSVLLSVHTNFHFGFDAMLAAPFNKINDIMWTCSKVFAAAIKEASNETQ